MAGTSKLSRTVESQWLADLAWLIHNSPLANARRGQFQNTLREWSDRQRDRKDTQEQWEEERDQLVIHAGEWRFEPPEPTSPEDVWEDNVAVFRGMVKPPPDLLPKPPPIDGDESQPESSSAEEDERRQALCAWIENVALDDPSLHCEAGDPKADGPGWVPTDKGGIECTGYVPPEYAYHKRPKAELPLPMVKKREPDLLDKAAILCAVHDFDIKGLEELSPWPEPDQDVPLWDIDGEQFIQAIRSRQPFTALLNLVEDLTEADGRVIGQYLEIVVAGLDTSAATGDVGDENGKQGVRNNRTQKETPDLDMAVGMALNHLKIDKSAAGTLKTPASKASLVWAFWFEKFGWSNSIIRDKTLEQFAGEYDLSDGDNGANAVLQGKKRGLAWVSKQRESTTSVLKTKN